MDVKRAVTNEQKETVLSVPDVFDKKDYYFDEEDAAVLNNVPGNKEIENMNYLNELSQVVKNWNKDERRVVIDNLPLLEMLEMIMGKVNVMEIFIKNQRNNVTSLDDYHIMS